MRRSRTAWANDAQAEAATRRAIARGMDDVHAYALLGRILNKQGRFEVAQTRLSQGGAVRSLIAASPARAGPADLDADR